MSDTNIIVIRGGSATNTVMIGSVLLKHYQDKDLNACIHDAFDVGEKEFQELYESNQYNYILVTLLNGDDFRPPCLEKPYLSINLD